MALTTGTRLGPYEIQSPLGAGGMGEVYRAKDTRLGREVAVKVLPPELSGDPVRKQRFEREAKAVSALNHPNICTLHDVGNQDGVEYLVMELVEGETLAKRLEKGPLPLEEVLRYGAQLAEALARAHRSGVVHRDLKPGNVMLTKTGAKLLDFGLARPAGLARGSAESGSSPTLAAPGPESPVTREGTVVGTFQYMSPEQVEGREVDARSDIFSLGVVLYEMVTGRRAFEGRSPLSVASAILEKEPEAIFTLKPLTPPALERTIRKCLAKHADQRWQDAGDLATQLTWTADASSSAVAAKAAGGSRRRVVGPTLAVLSIALAAAGAWTAGRRSRAALPVMRFAIGLPAGQALGGSWWWYRSLAVTRDGSRIAYVAHGGGMSQVYSRAIGEPNATPVAGTEGAETPFFSPDGRWLGFVAAGRLKKVPLAGGPPVTIADTAASGACWGADGTIYFGRTDSALFKVAASGGEPQQVTKLDAKKNETDHAFPDVLPGGEALVFVARNAEQPSFDEADIAAVSLATGERKLLVRSGTDPHYVPSGQLLFVRAGVLLAVPFDPVRLEVKGPAVPVAESVLENPRIGAGQYAASENGLLIDIPGGVTYGEHELVFVDKAGQARVLTATKRPYEDFTISPDGRFIATTIEGPVTDTWIHDVDRDTETRFTLGVENRDPTWTPDGKTVAYSGFRDGKNRVLWKPLDGSRPEESLLASDDSVDAWFFTPDGRALLYAQYGGSMGAAQNIGILPLDDRAHPRLLFPEQYNVEWAIASPDGKWIAFNGTESGRSEVYVAPFPSLAPRERISTDGGMHPLWSPDGRELYYRAGVAIEALEHRALAQRTRVMAVSIQTTPEFKAGKPRMLFEGPYFESGHDFAVTPDGKGFVLIRESESHADPKDMQVVVNWFEELREKVASAR